MAQSKIVIQALATCHNRSNVTMKCVKSLLEARIPQSVTLNISIVDDKSSDDTVSILESNFPQVEIIHGTGDLYWAGGMRYGWNFVKSRKFDYLFVFNDDTVFNSEFLYIILDLLNKSKKTSIIAGSINSCQSPKKIIYGGVKKYSWHPLRFRGSMDSFGIGDSDACNMNATLIPKKIFDNIGFLSDVFTHHTADFEYGLRAIKNGFKVIATTRAVGCSELNSKKVVNEYFSTSFIKTLKKNNHPKLLPYRERLFYFKEHAGYLWFPLFLAPYVRLATIYFITQLKRYVK